VLFDEAQDDRLALRIRYGAFRGQDNRALHSCPALLAFSAMTAARAASRATEEHPWRDSNLSCPTASLKRADVRRFAPKPALFLKAVIDFNVVHRTSGAGHIRQALLLQRDDTPSIATIGRWLQAIRNHCPVCRERGVLTPYATDGTHAPDLQRFYKKLWTGVN
jgi:hypothetical protein